MNKLQVGFCRMNINPPMGTPINGYQSARLVEGVLDDLFVNALAFRVENSCILLLAVDNFAIDSVTCQALRQHVADANGMSLEAVFLHTTHIHTAPQLGQINNWAPLTFKEQSDLLKEYEQLMYRRLADAAKLALADCQDARMGWAVGQARDISFVRQYRMKDGTVSSDPGMDNADVVSPVDQADAAVNILRFDRVNDTLVLANFGCLPDTLGGNLISADFPGFFRQRLEKSLDRVKCIFINGAHADVNAVGLDNIPQGYDHARHMGNVLAGAALQVFDKVNYEDVEHLGFLRKTIIVPSHLSKPEEVPLASKYYYAYESGRPEDIPYTGKKLQEVVAESGRILRLQYGPTEYQLELSGIMLGNVALLGLPGDAFSGIGSALKQAAGADLVLPMSLMDGFKGRFPTQKAYDEGYIEARSSCYRAGVDEQLIAAGIELINALH